MDKKYKIFILTALAFAVIDQLTKFFIRANFEYGQSIPLIKNIFHFTYLTNTGSAFGLFKGYNIFFIIFSILVIAAIFYFFKDVGNNQKLMQFSFGLLLAGTIGNLIDRIILKHVIDFLDFRIWPVFNVADSSITVSVVILVILLWGK
jgi:signal peptidase II